MTNTQVGAGTPRMMDQLQSLYNNQAQQNYYDHRKKQNLYYKIVQMQQSSMNDRKNMEKQLKNREDDKVKNYWRAEQQKYQQMQRRKKLQINNVRKVNQSLSMDIIQKSKAKEDFIPFNNYNEFYTQQMLKQKMQKQQFLRNAQQFEEIRKQKQKMKKKIDQEIGLIKLQQSQQLQRKRLAQLKRVRDKHQQNMGAFHLLDQKLKQKQAQQNMLQSYIVNRGADDQQSRMLQLRAQFEAKQKIKKQHFIRDLKDQLDSDTYRHIADKKTQVTSQRYEIDQRNRYFSEIDQMNKLRKSQADKKVLQQLKSQVKPRRILPETDKQQMVGLGSPVNIGKVVSDDRRRQLQWIQKSLLRQIHY